MTKLGPPEIIAYSFKDGSEGKWKPLRLKKILLLKYNH